MGGIFYLSSLIYSPVPIVKNDIFGLDADPSLPPESSICSTSQYSAFVKGSQTATWTESFDSRFPISRSTSPAPTSQGFLPATFFLVPSSYPQLGGNWTQKKGNPSPK